MHRKMGYNYQIEKAIFPDSLSKENKLTIQLEVNNIGVAHMYQDWNIQFAIIDEYNSPIEIYEVEYDLTKALSMKSFDLKKSIDKIPQGNHKIGIRIIQPMADKPKSESWGLDA